MPEPRTRRLTTERSNPRLAGTSPAHPPQPAGPANTSDRMVLDRAAMARRTGLGLPPALPFETWRRIGKQLSLIADSSGWWLGDWLVYGETQYAGRYRRAIDDTSLDYQTLRNYAWIARRFSMSRRRDRLSMQHHAEVAALPEKEQDEWLDRAERLGWSRNRLRNELRSSQAGQRQAPALVPVTVRIEVPPEREQLWQQAAQQSNRELAEWIMTMLDHAAKVILGSPVHSEYGNGGVPTAEIGPHLRRSIAAARDAGASDPGTAASESTNGQSTDGDGNTSGSNGQAHAPGQHDTTQDASPGADHAEATLVD